MNLLIMYSRPAVSLSGIPAAKIYNRSWTTIYNTI